MLLQRALESTQGTMSLGCIMGWVMPPNQLFPGETLGCTMGWVMPPNCLFPGETSTCLPRNTWFLRPTQVHITNGITTCSAVLAQLQQTHTQTDHAPTRTKGRTLWCGVILRRNEGPIYKISLRLSYAYLMTIRKLRLNYKTSYEGR